MYDIWQYIYSLLPNDIVSDINECLYINVVRVNPETLEIDDNPLLNTQVRIWLEFGLYVVTDCSNRNTIHEIIPGVNIPSYVMKGIKNKDYMIISTHDTDLDVRGRTFEKAFSKLYIRLKQKYGIINNNKE